jgi:hypothetical protein
MSNERENGNGADNFPLDDAAIGLLADIKVQMRILDAQWLGAQVLFIRQHGLKGNWQIAENGRELVRVPDRVPAAVMP